jgi:type VI protein secretion system component VasF
VAGENFFRRLRALLQAPRRLPAIQAYALCLALGFRGIYQQSKDAAPLGKFQRAAFRRLFAALPSPEISSPHLERPPAVAPEPSAWLFLPWLCGVLAVGLVLALCSWSVQRAGSALGEQASQGQEEDS